MLLPHQIEKVLASGGGISIDGSKFLPHQLERFAAYAASSGARLVIRNCKLLPHQMERVAAYGNNRVIFELT